MPRAEYKLYVSGAGSVIHIETKQPCFEALEDLKTRLFCFNVCSIFFAEARVIAWFQVCCYFKR